MDAIATPPVKGLPNDLIAKLMAGGRTRNAYGPQLKIFAESDEPAINVKEVWPLLYAAKEAGTLYQGFVTAIKKAELTERIVCRKSDDDVFLLDTEKCALITAAMVDGQSEDENE